MDQELNRAKLLWQNWEKLEQGLAAVEEIAEEHPRDITRQKYDFLRDGLYRLRDRAELHEKPYLALIGAVCDKLQKQLYKSPVLRFVQELKGELFDRPRVVKAHQDLVAENLAELRKHFCSRGLEAIAHKLEQHLDYERDSLVFAVSGQMDRNRTLFMNVHFEKDGTGKYQPGDIELALYGLGDPSGDVAILLEKQYHLNKVQLLNLLQHRPVYLFPGKGIEQDGCWLQLGVLPFEYNQYTLLVYEPDFGFNLKQALNNLALETGLLRLDAADVLHELRLGNAFQLCGRYPADAPFLINAEPANRGIVLTDLQGNPLTKQSLLDSLKHGDPGQASTVQAQLLLEKGQDKLIDPSQGKFL